MRIHRTIFAAILLVTALFPSVSLGDRIYLTNGEDLRGEVTELEDGTVEVLNPDGIDGAITFALEEIKSIDHYDETVPVNRTSSLMEGEAQRARMPANWPKGGQMPANWPKGGQMPANWSMGGGDMSDLGMGMMGAFAEMFSALEGPMQQSLNELFAQMADPQAMQAMQDSMQQGFSTMFEQMSDPQAMQAMQNSMQQGFSSMFGQMSDSQGVQQGAGSMVEQLSKPMLQSARKAEAYAMLSAVKTAQAVYFAERDRYATCKDAQEVASVLGVDMSRGGSFDYFTAGDQDAYIITAVSHPDAVRRGELPDDAKIVYSSRTDGYVEAGWTSDEDSAAGWNPNMTSVAGRN